MIDKNEIDFIVFTTEDMGLYFSRRQTGDNAVCGHFDDLIGNIKYILRLWVGKTSVGIPKATEVQGAFQAFFKDLMRLLIMLKESPVSTKKERSFSNAVLYRGKIYRYLGRGFGNSKKQGRIKPKYDGNYASWSMQRELSNYMASKLYGTKTLLSAEIENDYGISLKYFNFVQWENEKEIVYPTKKEAVYKVEYIDD